MTKGTGCLGATMLIGALLIVLVIFGLFFAFYYNGFVAKQEQCDKAWANVQTDLQRRYDLIPNLVSTVKGYAEHEENVLTEVTKLRSQWANAKTPEKQAEAAMLLEGALGRLLLVVERYPNLKANESFLALQGELSHTENRIAAVRDQYNEAVRRYNVAIRKFPGMIFAGLAGFERRTPFMAAEGAASAPVVKF